MALGVTPGRFNLETLVADRKTRPSFDRLPSISFLRQASFDKLRTNEFLYAYRKGEVPLALSSPRSGCVEGLAHRQSTNVGSSFLAKTSQQRRNRALRAVHRGLLCGPCRRRVAAGSRLADVGLVRIEIQPG
jgi:hypothetical protein